MRKSYYQNSSVTIQLLQDLSNGTDVLQNLPNGKKSLQNYGMEHNHWVMSHSLHFPINLSMVLPLISLFQDNYQ